MTNKDAIEYIKTNCYGEYCEDDWRNAMDMAIRSLEAWSKVTEEITEYLEEYGDTDTDGNHSPKWCAMKEAESVIKKHLKEVKE